MDYQALNEIAKAFTSFCETDYKTEESLKALRELAKGHGIELDADLLKAMKIGIRDAVSTWESSECY